MVSSPVSNRSQFRQTSWQRIPLGTVGAVIGELTGCNHVPWRRMKIRGKQREKERAATIDRGMRLVAALQEQEAISFLAEAIERFPEDGQIRLLYATALLAFRPDDVVSQAAKAVELDPNDPGLLVRAAHLVLNRGDVAAARSYAARANELVHPGFVHMSGLHHLNGIFAGMDGNYDVAEEKLRMAVEMDPAFSSFAVDLVKLLVHQGRQDETIGVIDAALRHVPDKSALEQMRGEIASA